MKNTNKNSAKTSILLFALIFTLFGSFYGCSENSSNILGVDHNTSSGLPNNPDKEKNDVIWSSYGFDVMTLNGYGENCVDFYFEKPVKTSQVRLELDVDTPAEKLGYKTKIDVTIKDKTVEDFRMETSSVNGHHTYRIYLPEYSPNSTPAKLCIKGTLFTDDNSAPETGMKVRNIKMFEK